MTLCDCSCHLSPEGDLITHLDPCCEFSCIPWGEWLALEIAEVLA